MRFLPEANLPNLADKLGFFHVYIFFYLFVQCFDLSQFKKRSLQPPTKTMQLHILGPIKYNPISSKKKKGI